MPLRLPGGFNFANNGYFTGSAPLPFKALNFTYAVVFNASTVSTYQTFLSQGRADTAVTGTAASFYLVKQNLVEDFMYASQTFTTTNVSASKLSFGVIVTAAGSGKNSIGSLNGGTGETGNYPDGTLKVDTTCFALGRLCPTRLNNNLFTGTMHEVMVFSTNLPDSLRYWVDGYFAWKWGVVDNLPATHLYFGTPPV